MVVITAPNQSGRHPCGAALLPYDEVQPLLRRSRAGRVPDVPMDGMMLHYRLLAGPQWRAWGLSHGTRDEMFYWMTGPQPDGYAALK